MNAPASGPPLWQLLLATAGALRAVREGASTTPALASVPVPLRPGVQALLGQYLLTMVVLLPLCGAAAGLSYLGSRL